MHQSGRIDAQIRGRNWRAPREGRRQSLLNENSILVDFGIPITVLAPHQAAKNTLLDDRSTAHLLVEINILSDSVVKHIQV